MTRVCPRCAATNSPRADRCGECAAKLGVDDTYFRQRRYRQRARQRRLRAVPSVRVAPLRPVDVQPEYRTARRLDALVGAMWPKDAA